MNKKFHELAVGDKFKLDGISYIRITDERISCCKVFNAKKLDTNEKVQIVPITEVSLIEENS